MIAKINSPKIDLSSLDTDFRAGKDAAGRTGVGTGNSTESKFLNMLKDGISNVNEASKEAEKSSMDLASGRSSNIHETMLTAAKAEIGFNLLVQLRNKAIEAYQDVMRMQV